MTAVDIYRREFNSLMRYSLTALIEIAQESYGLVMNGATKESIADACANIEVQNWTR